MASVTVIAQWFDADNHGLDLSLVWLSSLDLLTANNSLTSCSQTMNVRHTNSHSNSCNLISLTDH